MKYFLCQKSVLTGVLLWLICSSAVGQVKVPRLISDGMVLQREIPIRIWGWASPGEKVTVKFDGETVTGETDDRGKWRVGPWPKKAGGPFVMAFSGMHHRSLMRIL